MKNILVIGGNGFIGSKLVSQLVSEGYNISILCLNQKYFHENIKTYFGTLENIDTIKSIVVNDGIDTMIHLATSLIPSSDFEDYLNEYNTLIIPTIKMLKILTFYNVKLIYISSGGAIYGVNGKEINAESDKSNPISYYGQSKYLLEESIKFENRISGLNYIILRPSNAYGIGQNIFGKQGFIAASIGKIIDKGVIDVWGDGTIVRDYINIIDLVKGIIALIKHGKENEVYNIGSGIGYSINEIIDILKKCTNRSFEVNYLPGRSVDVSSVILNVEKFNDTCNFPKIQLDLGIREFYNYEISRVKKNI